jgi:hypothetical protein
MGDHADRDRPLLSLRGCCVALAAATEDPALALALAACGGGSSADVAADSITHPTGSANQINLSTCMRAHGVPNFPDPTKGPDGNEGMSVKESEAGGPVTVEGISFSGSAFRAAQKSCGMFAGRGHRGGEVPDVIKHEDLAFAACMRAHGVPSFPDPQFPPGGGIEQAPPTGVSSSSPAYEAANNACARAHDTP